MRATFVICALVAAVAIGASAVPSSLDDLAATHSRHHEVTEELDLTHMIDEADNAKAATHDAVSIENKASELEKGESGQTPKEVAACAPYRTCNRWCWNEMVCPEGQTKYGDGSACTGGGKPNCDLGFCSNSPNGNMPQCTFPGSDPSNVGWIPSSTTLGKSGQTRAQVALCAGYRTCNNWCWLELSCPSGQTRSGDGSACRGGSRPDCDLGFCSNNPNGGMPQCSFHGSDPSNSGWIPSSTKLGISGQTRAEVSLCAAKKTCKNWCWLEMSCPFGQTRVGDGSACSGGGKPTCDLGFCSNSPNGGIPSCPITESSEIALAKNYKQMFGTMMGQIKNGLNAMLAEVRSTLADVTRLRDAALIEKDQKIATALRVEEDFTATFAAYQALVSKCTQDSDAATSALAVKNFAASELSKRNPIVVRELQALDSLTSMINNLKTINLQQDVDKDARDLSMNNVRVSLAQLSSMDEEAAPLTEMIELAREHAEFTGPIVELLNSLRTKLLKERDTLSTTASSSATAWSNAASTAATSCEKRDAKNVEQQQASAANVVHQARKVAAIREFNDIQASYVLAFNNANAAKLQHSEELRALNSFESCSVVPQSSSYSSCREILALNPTAKDGVYLIKPSGQSNEEKLFCDMTNDGGGWTLVYKSDMSNSNDRTEAAANVAALENPSLNTVAKVSDAFANAIGKEYRTLIPGAGAGAKIFVKSLGLPLFRITDSATIASTWGVPANSANSNKMQIRYNNDAGWVDGVFSTWANHAPCLYTEVSCGTAPCMCFNRWCCGAANGLFVAGPGVSGPRYQAGSVWVR